MGAATMTDLQAIVHDRLDDATKRRRLVMEKQEEQTPMQIEATPDLMGIIQNIDNSIKRCQDEARRLAEARKVLTRTKPGRKPRQKAREGVAR